MADNVQEIFDNESLSIYDKKRQLVRKVLSLRDNLDDQNPDISQIELCKDYLLELIDNEVFNSNKESLRQLIIRRPDKFDNAVIEKYTDNEWTLIDSFADEKINDKITFWGLVLLMRNYIGNTRSYITPRHFYLASAVYECQDLKDNKLASVKNLYKKYCSGSAHTKVTKFI